MIKPTEVKTSAETESVPSPVASEKDCCEHDNNMLVRGVVLPIEKSEEPESDGTPDIVKTLIYYGLGEGKKPDPHKILYYERPDGSCIDVQGKTTLATRPPVLDHLPSRPITVEDRDVVAAIAHGAMSDKDFSALDENGMIGDVARQIWEKTQKLSSLRDDMAKADALAKSEEEDEEAEAFGGEETPEEEAAEAEETEGDDEAYEEGEAEESGEDMSDDLAAVKDDLGSDVFQEIMDLAMARALNALSGGDDDGEGLEAKIRSIVRQEIEAILGDEGSSEEPEYELSVDDGPTEEYEDESDDEGGLMKSDPLSKGDLLPLKRPVKKPTDTRTSEEKYDSASNAQAQGRRDQAKQNKFDEASTLDPNTKSWVAQKITDAGHHDLAQKLSSGEMHPHKVADALDDRNFHGLSAALRASPGDDIPTIMHGEQAHNDFDLNGKEEKYIDERRGALDAKYMANKSSRDFTVTRFKPESKYQDHSAPINALLYAHNNGLENGVMAKELAAHVTSPKARGFYSQHIKDLIQDSNNSADEWGAGPKDEHGIRFEKEQPGEHSKISQGYVNKAKALGDLHDKLGLNRPAFNPRVAKSKTPPA